MTELTLTPSDIQALRAMGVSAPAERRRPDDLACMLKEKMDGLTFTYEREIGRILDQRNRLRRQCDLALLAAAVSFLICVGLAVGQ